MRTLLTGEAANIRMCEWFPFEPRFKSFKPSDENNDHHTPKSNRIFKQKKVRRKIATASRRRNRK